MGKECKLPHTVKECGFTESCLYDFHNYMVKD